MSAHDALIGASAMRHVIAKKGNRRCNLRRAGSLHLCGFAMAGGYFECDLKYLSVNYFVTLSRLVIGYNGTS